GAGRRLPPRGLDELDAKSLGFGELEIYPVAVAQPHPYGPALAVLSHDGPAEFAVDAVDLLALGHRGASARELGANLTSVGRVPPRRPPGSSRLGPTTRPGIGPRGDWRRPGSSDAPSLARFRSGNGPGELADSLVALCAQLAQASIEIGVGHSTQQKG